MNIQDVLKSIETGELKAEEAYELISNNGFSDMSFAKVDLGRQKRCGLPEVIFCAGKTSGQIAEIAKCLRDAGQPMLATKATAENYRAVKEVIPEAAFYERPGIITAGEAQNPVEGKVSIVSAGTADIPIADETALTCGFFGSAVEQVYDVGAAGLHRISAHVDSLNNTDVVVVVAGMDGVLPTIVSGMVDAPVIAVPTSVGYGASFDGLAALLTMLNSCAPGLSVVNIDNGFGAAYMACKILRKVYK